MSAGKILFVGTSHTQLLNGKPTGGYLPEIAHPYYVLKNAGYEIVYATPKGGEAPIDPGSIEMFKEDPDSAKFMKDAEAQALVKSTSKLSQWVGKEGEFKAVFYPGGHGPVFDLPVDKDSQALIRDFYEAGKPVAVVCHGTAVLVDVTLSNGDNILKGHKVTGFSNSEEETVGLTKAIPFLLETVVKERGATYEKAAQDWGEYVVADESNGKYLLSGQNPASAAKLGHEIVKCAK